MESAIVPTPIEVIPVLASRTVVGSAISGIMIWPRLILAVEIDTTLDPALIVPLRLLIASCQVGGVVVGIRVSVPIPRLFPCLKLRVSNVWAIPAIGINSPSSWT